MASFPDTYYRLALLNEVAAGGHLTQRVLASRLAVSLGQANKLLREVEDAGLVKVDPELRSRYILSPEGERERAGAAARFAAEAHALLAPTRAQMSMQAEALYAQKKRKALLCAPAAWADAAVAALSNAGLKVIGILVPDDPVRRKVAGVAVLDAKACRKAAFDVAVCVSSAQVAPLQKALGRKRSITQLLEAEAEGE